MTMVMSHCAIALTLTLSTADEPAGGPKVIVNMQQGADVTGSLRGWSAEGEILIEESKGAPKTFGASDWVTIRFTESKTTPQADGWTFYLRNGSRILVSKPVGHGEKVQATSSALGIVEFPLAGLIGIRAGGEADMFESAGEWDRLVLRSGDVLTGIVSTTNETGLLLLSDQGADEEDHFEWPAIQSIQFAETAAADIGGAATGLAASARYVVTLSDGSMASVGEIVSDGNAHFVLEMASQRFTVKPADLISIERIDTNRIWLSQLEPADYASVPYFSRQWPLQRDVNAVGDPLRIRRTTYARGLGLHAGCYASWQLNGAYRRLTGFIGVDDSGGPWSDADVVFRAGDAVLHEEKSLRHTDAPRRIEIDLRGLPEITIEIRYGRNGDVLDRINFVDAALHK